jgi:hypothetical protein
MEHKRMKSKILLIPHSEAWFAALLKINSQQAGHTRLLVQTAGKPDICSICGDEGGQDFSVVGASLGPDMDFTIRLCNDCLEIRKMQGEKFVRINEGNCDNQNN